MWSSSPFSKKENNGIGHLEVALWIKIPFRSLISGIAFQTKWQLSYQARYNKDLI